MNLAPEPSLAGSVVLDGKAVYLTILGEAGLDAALGTLPAADAEVYAATTAVSWVPIRIVDALITAVARALGEDPIAFNVRASRISIERTVRTIFRPFLRLTTTEAILTRAPAIYRKSYSHGAMEQLIVNGNHASFALVGWPGVSSLQIAGLGAGTEAVLTVAGRRDCVAHGKRSPTGAVYTVSWR